MTPGSASAARRWWVLALLGTAFFMTILDGTSLLTALPSIERSLRISGPAFQWAVTAYALAFSGPLLLCGRAADLLGRRRMFAAGMVPRCCAGSRPRSVSWWPPGPCRASRPLSSPRPRCPWS
jgi:MFS family permease